jgi:hypothetical protein
VGRSDQSVWEVLIYKEDRFVWRLLLARNEFDAALQHCTVRPPAPLRSLASVALTPWAQDAAQRDKVLIAQADHLYDMCAAPRRLRPWPDRRPRRCRKQYERAAGLYARTQRSFETVALRFVQDRQMDALREFLLVKLASFRPGVRPVSFVCLPPR